MVSTSDVSPPPTMTDQMSPSNTWNPPPSYTSTYNQYGSPSPMYQPPPPPAYTSTHNSPPQYGSGSNSWGSNPYEDCVQQCQAKYPGLTSGGMSYGNSSSGGSSSGDSPSKTHVVWVAPTQGVLRYVPFAINASVGDTVKFVWGANNHTVTKGSELTPCNATSDSPFSSGLQLKDFVFEQVVNDTNPLFVYCAVPTHCAKGMFGIINPPNALGAPSSVGSMMQTMVASNPDLGKMRTYTDNATMSSGPASTWGTNFDMSSIPSWAQESFVENVLYTRTFLAANPEAFTSDGGIDASLGGNPPVVPQDITQVALNSNSPNGGYGSGSSSPSNVTSTSTVAPSPSSSSVGSNSNLSNDASVTRSGLTVVLAALAAGFFLL